MTREQVDAIMHRDMPGWKVVKHAEAPFTDDIIAFKARYKLDALEVAEQVWVEMAGGSKPVIIAQGRVIGFQG